VQRMCNESPLPGYPPETPCARLLPSAANAEPMKDRLRALLATLDPLRLLDEIRSVQHHLAGLIVAAQRRGSACPPTPAEARVWNRPATKLPPSPMCGQSSAQAECEQDE
jgi:hypothetical protein